MRSDLLYFLPHRDMSAREVVRTLSRYPEIRFVSLIGVDLAGNDTDEKIPIRLFLENPGSFYEGTAVQTDGSSVVFKNIATLNNAKVDMIADREVNWYVDYNHENNDPDTGKPVGTLRIPAFLLHEGSRIDSRAILTDTLSAVSKSLLALFQENTGSNAVPGSVESFEFTAGTELEFWVKTPAEIAIVEELSASQVMQENYWQRTRGQTRTALEQSLIMLERYGLKPEMGHKEVGGVKAQINERGVLSHVLEQMEIDWRYSDALQAADNELLARMIIKEIFRKNGLEVSFKAKPIPGVAGNGKHTHIGIVARMKDGSKTNLFTPADMNRDFLSVPGYGALMGFLKNYEVVNPFISATTDSLNRLKPGFEAPVCTVCSLGHSPVIPSRNRTVLAGLIRDLRNPEASRFEIRSPNPLTNTYLSLTAILTTMTDGINQAVRSGLTTSELEQIISKKSGESVFYLEPDREYRSEEDVFDHYQPVERHRLFGRPPRTVFENMQNFNAFPPKTSVLKHLGVLSDRLIDSFKDSALVRWKTEICRRIIPDHVRIIKSSCEIQDGTTTTDRDIEHWNDIQKLRLNMAKDSCDALSLFTRIRRAIADNDLKTASDLVIEMDQEMDRLRESYDVYRKNMICS